MPSLIIGLCGLPGCGKGTAAEIIRRDYGAGYFRFSKIMGDLLDRLHREKTRDNLIRMSETMRQAFGEDVFSYAIEQDMLGAPEQVVVLDGIRRPEDIVALEPMPSFKLVAIDTQPKLRYERMKKRGEKSGEADMTWHKFQQEEQAPTERTIPGIMARAWRTIPNNGTIDEFSSMIHELMRDLGVSIK